MKKRTKKELAVFFGVPYNAVVEAILKLNHGKSSRQRNLEFDPEQVRPILIAKYDAALDRLSEEASAYNALKRNVELAGAEEGGMKP